MSVPINEYNHSKRFSDLSSKFIDHFGCKPEFFVRAPGRVNLIGEHIDYCGYGVCPMALEHDVVMAVSANESSEMNIFNLNEAKYPNFNAGKEPQIDLSEPRWYNYVLCGVIGMTQHLGIEFPIKGLNILVHGVIPPSAGLSSSSALVCAAAVVIYHVFGTDEISANQLAELCAGFERLIGTQGGGMDQAASFLSQAGSACAIEFDPLRTCSVALPPGMSFVVANSGVELNKSATAHFNIRVNECRLASMILAKRSGLEWRNVLKLAALQKALGLSLEEMICKVKKELHEEIYTRQEIADNLGVPENILVDEILTPNVRSVENFNLYSRAIHVYGEALRVKTFVETCKGSSQEGQDCSLASKLGDLMNQSHHSCSVLYECSCPLLDQLVNKSCEAGALGSRLTGAGWGGCSVSLVPTEMAENFIEKLMKDYYAENCLKSDIFVTLPSTGVYILRGE